MEIPYLFGIVWDGLEKLAFSNLRRKSTYEERGLCLIILVSIPCLKGLGYCK